MHACPVHGSQDASSVHEPDVWVADSGCTVHCVTSVDKLTTVDRQGSVRPPRVADNRHVPVTHTGKIAQPVRALSPSGDLVDDVFRLGRVLVVPSFSENLFSCSAGS